MTSDALCTPGSRRSRSSRSLSNRTMASPVAYVLSGSEKFATSVERGSNPGSTRSSRALLLTSTPATARSVSATAVSSATSQRCSPRREPTLRRPAPAPRAAAPPPGKRVAQVGAGEAPRGGETHQERREGGDAQREEQRRR